MANEGGGEWIMKGLDWDNPYPDPFLVCLAST